MEKERTSSSPIGSSKKKKVSLPLVSDTSLSAYSDSVQQVDMDRYAKTGRNGKKRGVIVERPASGGKEVEDMKRNVGKEGKEGADEEERKFLRREKDQTSHESKRRRATKKTIPSSKSAVGDKYSHRGGETGVEDEEVFGKGRWIDWPAPKQSMDAAREFIREM